MARQGDPPVGPGIRACESRSTTPRMLACQMRIAGVAVDLIAPPTAAAAVELDLRCNRLSRRNVPEAFSRTG